MPPIFFFWDCILTPRPSDELEFIDDGEEVILVVYIYDTPGLMGSEWKGNASQESTMSYI